MNPSLSLVYSSYFFVFVLALLSPAISLANKEEAEGHTRDSGGMVPGSLANVSSSPFFRHLMDGSLPFPVYYINVEANQIFRQRMEKTFGTVWDLRRVPARRKKDITSLHLKTIRHAYLQGDQFVFVTEDKISPLLMPFWTSSIRDLVIELQEREVEWNTFQLGWLLMKDRRIYEDTKWGPGQRILSHPVQAGASAYILSRTGMEEVLKQFFTQEEEEQQNSSPSKEGGNAFSKIQPLPKDDEGNIPQIDQYLARIGKNFLALPSLFTVDAFEKPVTKLDWVEPERFSNHAHIDATLSLVHRLAGETEQIV